MEENWALVEEARRRVSGRRPRELGILFLYHKTCDVTERNLESLERSGHLVIPISMERGAYFSSGYWLEQTPFWGDLTGYDPRRCWYNMDACYYEYYRRRNENCKRWLLAEWDVLCKGRVEDFYGNLWDEDFVAATIHPPEGSRWHWFKEVESLPYYMRGRAFGASPLAGVLLSDDCMERIVRESWRIDAFCELRIATLARFAGLLPIRNPRARGKLKWRPSPVVDGDGLWHPVKEM